MNRTLFPKVNKSLLCLIAIQLFVLFFALGLFILHKNDSVSRTFVADDFILSAGELTEDLAVIDDTSGHNGSFLTVSSSLPKGSYQIQINYLSTATGNSAGILASDISNIHFRSNSIQLHTTTANALLTLELGSPCENVSVNISYGGAGILEIYSISIVETTSFYKRGLVYALGICALLSLGYFFLQAPPATRKTVFLLGAIFCTSCIPLLVDYMIVGHDLPFHLLRIEGVHHSLRQGIFPVKIDPVWAKDYGYAVSVFYGNALLYIPAFLRLFGFTVQGAYKTFVLFMNLGTVLLSYYSFKIMFRSERAGIWGSLLYTLSIYRLSDLYVRAAVGEYSALMFLPLVLCGFYLAFTAADSKTYKWWKPVSMISLGLTGVIQTHILTCEMIAVLVIIVCLVLIKKVFQPGTFRILAVSAISTVLLNLGFLVPFLDYYTSDINIRSEEWGSGAFDLIQGKGMFPAQLLNFLPKYTGGSWDTVSGISSEATYAPGIVLLLFALLFLYIVLCEKETYFSSQTAHLHKPAVLCCILGFFTLWMSSCYFPYDALSGLHPVAATLVSSLQFPWRFLAPATVLLVFVAVYTIMQLSDHKQTNGVLLLSVLALLFAVNIGWFYHDYMYTGSPYRVYETHELDSMAMYSYEYLPTGTDPSLITEGRILTDNCTYTDYTKEGTSIHTYIDAGPDGGYITFPLNHYKYYACVDADTGQYLETAPGYNNMVKVTIPENYNGEIKVFFREPLHWRIAEIVSLLTFAAGIIVVAIKNRGLRNNPA